MEILIHPNEILRQKSKEIDRDFLLSKKTQELIKEMTETMDASDGIGLAAPQVGENIRICIIGKEAIRLANPDHNTNLVLVNPVWSKTSYKKAVDAEGCLSVPNTYGKVKRYKNIQVKAMNEKGEPISFEATDFIARVIQHEIDHLDGILFIDKAKDIHTVE